MKFFIIGLFWVHQLIFGLTASLRLLDDFMNSRTGLDLLHGVALTLFWIGGTLVWSFAVLLIPKKE